MSAKSPHSGVLHSRPFQAGAAAALAVVILGLGYLGTRDQPHARNLPVENLSIAVPMVPHAALLYIAAAKGYFAEEGLDVSIEPAIHGPEAISFVAQGKADLATASEVAVVLAIMRGVDLGIAANMLTTDQMTVVARRDRGISTPADLAQKIIGVSFGTAGEYYMWAYLIRHKISPGLISFVNLTPAQIPQALAKGTIDATATWQPIVFEAQSALGKENAVSFTGDGAYTETHVVAGHSAFLKNHPQAIAKLMRAMLKAENFNRSAPEEALNLVAGRLNVDAKDLRPIWNDFNFSIDLRQSYLITLEDEARWAMARGYAPRGPVPNFLPHLYLDALLAVQPERVTVWH